MRVLLDTNVLLSYLLSHNAQETIVLAVEACLQLSEIDLLLPQAMLDELKAKVVSKRYFVSRIPSSAVDDLIARLRAIGELVTSPMVPDIYTRDRTDDYLVACGVVLEADFLVSGDLDLRVLGQVGTVRIVTPAEFVRELLDQRLLSL